MKIKEIRQITAYRVETDKKECASHTRYGPDSWTVSMGESDEQVYDCAELEAAFQAFIATARETNARLISAAPDLPATLKEIAGSAGFIGGSVTPAMIERVARAAIAKAKGAV